MLYEKPIIRLLVATDSPICTTHPELIKDRFGPVSQCSCMAPCDCQVTCFCQCICPCECTCPCPCTCKCECKCECKAKGEQSRAEWAINPPYVLGLPQEKILNLAISEETFKLSEKYKFRKEASGGLLFNTITWDIQKLNDTGSNVLQLLNGKRTPIDIAKELGKLYGIAPELILSDVEQFIGLLQYLGAAITEEDRD